MEFAQSPNFNKGRNGNKIEGVVMHTTAGTYSGSRSWFLTSLSKVSAHYIIGTDGYLINMVKDDDTAWHCGNLSVNRKTIGIEHVDDGNPQGPRTLAQFERSAVLLAELSKKYNFPLDRKHVIKHKEVKATACPGNLDVDAIIRRAIEINNPPTPSQETADSVTVTSPIGVNLRTSANHTLRNVIKAIKKDGVIFVENLVDGTTPDGVNNKWWKVRGETAYVWSGSVKGKDAVKTDPPPSVENPQTVTIPQRELINIGIKAKNFDRICDYFGITEGERVELRTGEDIVENFKLLNNTDVEEKKSSLFKRLYNKLFIA